MATIEQAVTASQITITVSLGNEAMQTAYDVHEAVRAALLNAQRGVYEPLLDGDGSPVWDDNGNRVGEWKAVA